jgi:hypothetical protein
MTKINKIEEKIYFNYEEIEVVLLINYKNNYFQIIYSNDYISKNEKTNIVICSLKQCNDALTKLKLTKEAIKYGIKSLGINN